MPYVFLGTADDKTQQYPYAPTKRHAAELKTLLVMNAVLSPPIVIEEGFLLAAGEALTMGASGSVLTDAIASGLLKVMSRSGDLEGYAKLRRAKRHITPPDTPEGRRFLSELQTTCEVTHAFVPYPPPSIDQTTFERLCSLANDTRVRDVFAAHPGEFSEFPGLFELKYAKGLEGQQWTARSAWESAALGLFSDSPSAVHALMTLANRQRQLIRGSALASSLEKPVIVETGFELGGEDLITNDATIGRGIVVRRSGRRQLASLLPMQLLVEHYRQIFAALADTNSSVSKAKAQWIKASEEVPHAERVQNSLESFVDATNAYALTLQSLAQVENRKIDSPDQIEGVNALDVGYGIAIPASLQIVTGSNLSRREVIRNASALGILFGADYLLRPWSISTKRPSRSRLIVAKQSIDLDDIGALTAVQTNFHERLVVSPDGLR